MLKPSRDYVPMRHPTVDGWRVPVWVNVDGNDYTISVGADHYRYYTHETLPDKVKVLITMVRAFPVDDLPERMINPTNVYVNMHNREQDSIGWRISENMYILILDRETLEEVQHGTHAREKSKDESRRATGIIGRLLFLSRNGRIW